ncbi:glycoside hydrolase [Trametopsis cervina]|nr:glycoside hydrolase [Trametopsis cervina]
MRLLHAAVALAGYLPLFVRSEVFSLADLTWHLQNQNGSISIPASLPSQVHLELLKAGIITEPVLGINDFTQRWIANDNWTYTADLTPLIKKVSSHKPRTILVFYGIDTVANISVAGTPVSWVNNEFLQYVYDVTDLLSSPSSTDHNLTVSLESAWLYAQNVTARPDVEKIPLPDFEYPGVREFVRKTPSDFGWDWGPAFVPAGIHKPAYAIILPTVAKTTTSASIASHPLLVSQDSHVFFEQSGLEISKEGQTPIAPPDESADWVVNVTLWVRSSVAVNSPSISISIPELRINARPVPVSRIPGSTNSTTYVSAIFKIPEGTPERWFPHNLGTPKLYNLTTTLHLGDHNTASFVTQTGFRTITLVQTPYPQSEVDARGITPGDQWHFEINGKAFYSSGTNIIPFDPFYARITTEKVRWILESALLSGQNMLRVWGGGAYQPDSELTGGYDFYNACNELGILAWSELIFSDALYPTNDFFLESYDAELRQNVRRINKHPSNAQWAGGNEIELIAIMVNATLHKAFDEYQFLFGDFLYDVVSEETHSVAYTDCSTTGGVLSLDPYVIRYSNTTPGHIYGNTERYNYDASQAFNYSTYPVSRFVNEFGFHSMPSFFSWEEVLQSPDDFSFNSTVVMSRDHHNPAGNLTWPNPNAAQGQGQMTQGVELWLPTPSTSDSNQTFAQWCWSTQIFQSLNMVSEIAWYRHGAGQGENNLGSLLWQMNDIWQAPTWASVEYSGRWKVVQYGMVNIYSPIIIYPFWTAENETLRILATSDRWDTVNGRAQLTWYDWSGKTLNTSTHEFSIPTLNNSLISETTGLKNILPANQSADQVWLLLNLTAKVNNKTVTNEQVFTPISLANATLVDPQIEVKRHKNLSFTLSARGGVAPWTWIDHPSGTVGYFVDDKTNVPTNGFYLIPGIDRTLIFKQNTKLSTVKSPNPDDFIVRSLWNNTHV